MEFRIVKKGNKYYPQYKNPTKRWKDIVFDGSTWDNYSKRYSFVNAKQRLYNFMYGIAHKAISMFEIHRVGNITHWRYISLDASKEETINIYSEYKGKTEFLKTIFPDYFKK